MSKKTLIGTGLIFAALILFLTGCIEVKREIPENWDVEDASSAWTIVKTGIIDVKKYHRSKVCDKAPVCEQHSSCHGSYVQFSFDDGSIYLIGKIRRFGAVVEGSSGTLYKYDTGKTDGKSWFQWVEDKSQSQIKEKLKDEKPVTYSQKKIVKIKNSWKDISRFLPTPHTIVLVKIDGKIITTAYINQKNDWKLGSNIEKTSGGSSLYNITEWKKIDLE